MLPLHLIFVTVKEQASDKLNEKNMNGSKELNANSLFLASSFRKVD